MTDSLHCMCQEDRFARAFLYEAPPAGEVRFPFSEGSYRREVLRCTLCGHFISRHTMDMSALYSADYVNATYGDNGIKRTFDRIIALDPAKSDNVGRVNRIVAFAQDHLAAPAPTILDVGSGLCVFLYRIKQITNWHATALDPDERAVRHAREVVGVDGLCADFMQADSLGRYDIITFNKVLEHVIDPVAMLARSLRFLNEGGFVYIELPDGECAVHDGPGREEFFIEHHHIFSAASLALLATRAGFTVRQLERLQEPSTKYTLRAFLVAS